MIDLHIHSTFSDGSETPEDIVAASKRLGLSAIALTDHDNMSGVPAFLDACRAEEITGIAGVEISVALDESYGDDSTLHILGFGLDSRNPQARELLGRVLDGRAWRNEQILTKLDHLGVGLDWEEIEVCVGEDVMGRPHIAQAMVDRNYVSTPQEAFDRYLAKGAPAYVDRYRLFADEAVQMIADAGGLTFCAHPFTWISDETRLKRELREFKERGLVGVEAWHSDHSEEQVVALLRMAKQLGLMVSGGSDYHGEVKPRVKLGSGRGNLAIDDSYAVALVDALGRDNPHLYVAG